MSAAEVLDRTRVAVLFGGANSEHEVSCSSARSVEEHLDRRRFTPVFLGADRHGGWHRLDRVGDLATADPAEGRRLPDLAGIDVALPVLHGRFGEDGTLQGLLELAGVPYVGNGVLASAVAMDKARCQRVLDGSGIPTVPTVEVSRATRDSAVDAAAALGYPLFVKPNRSGSSVGTARVAGPAALSAAVDAALEHDESALLQPFQAADEVDVAVLQRPAGPLAVAPALRVRLNPDAQYFDYSSKYSAGSVEFEIPARVPAEVTERLRALAVRAFEALGCEGLARIDFFVGADGRVVLNEVNTMPGLTSLSQFPRMWAAAGMSYPDLLSALLDRAFAARGTPTPRRAAQPGHGALVGQG
jgi:D-alanine-D-alanine ligase